MQVNKFIVYFNIFKIVGLGTFCLPLGNIILFDIDITIIRKNRIIAYSYFVTEKQNRQQIGNKMATKAFSITGFTQPRMRPYHYDATGHFYTINYLVNIFFFGLRFRKKTIKNNVAIF